MNMKHTLQASTVTQKGVSFRWNSAMAPQPSQFQKGHDFEKRVFDAIRGQKWKEVTLQPLDSQGKPVMEDGKELRVRMDIVRFGNNNNLRLLECKSSQSAPLTHNQKIGFECMEKNGFEVVTHHLFLPKGYRQGPTKVEIVRPESAEWQVSSPAQGPGPVMTKREVAMLHLFAALLSLELHATHPRFAKEVCKEIKSKYHPLEQDAKLLKVLDYFAFWKRNPGFLDKLRNQGHDPFHPSMVSMILDEPNSQSRL